MKTKTLRMISLMLAMVFIFTSSPFGVFATNQPASFQTEVGLYIENYANSVSNNGEKYQIISSQVLKSFTLEKSYVLYNLYPLGYAIYDEISGVVEELMLGVNSPYSSAQKGTWYYGGPTNYIVEKDNKFISLTDNRELSNSYINDLVAIEQNTVSSRKTARAIPTDTRYHYVKSSQYFTSMLGEDFGNNVNGTCTQVACAIMLGYYNYYVNTQFVPTAYEQGVGTTDAFHLYLQNFMGSTSSGLENAANGLNAYFDAIYFTAPTAQCVIGDHNAVFSKVSTNISNNRPTVISMFSSYNSNCTMNHSVVVYGYREEVTLQMMTSASYYVHTGWHNPKIGTYAWDWFADALYIV